MDDEAIDDEAMDDEASDDALDDDAIDDEAMDDEASDDAMDDEAMDDAMDDEAMDDEAMDDAMALDVTTITVTIENISADAATPTPLAPGVWVTHEDSISLFKLGAPDAGLGLEALAEDGNAAGLAGALPGATGVHYSDTFTNPDGGTEPGPALPGSSYSFTAMVSPGLNISFATMFVQSNDWIFATPPAGLNLFDADGNLVEGDITADLIIVDSGTETDQTPGEGADQAPRQSGPNTGAEDEDSNVRIVDGRNATDYIRVTVTAG
jgi:hypothetical protein